MNRDEVIDRYNNSYYFTSDSDVKDNEINFDPMGKNPDGHKSKNKKEIDKVCLYDNFMDKYFGGFILIIILMFIIVLVIVSCLSVPPYVPKNNTYQTGTLYSTVKIKDFNEKS